MVRPLNLCEFSSASLCSTSVSRRCTVTCRRTTTSWSCRRAISSVSWRSAMMAGLSVCAPRIDSSDVQSHSLCHIHPYRVSAVWQQRTARVQCACSGLLEKWSRLQCVTLVHIGFLQNDSAWLSAMDNLKYRSNVLFVLNSKVIEL